MRSISVVNISPMLNVIIILGNLCQLGILSLRDNKLQYLPNEVGNCVELHVLDVSGNK